MTPEQRLIELAKTFVGTKEEGLNKGKLIEAFQKAVDGYARGEPYCIGFIQYCAKLVDSEMGTVNQLFKTEHSISLWDKTPKALRLKKPEPGCVIVWQKMKDGKPTMQGHGGIVIQVLDSKRVQTIEANTSGGPGIKREGDGVYYRYRSVELVDGAAMKLLGFIRCWPEMDAKGDPSGSAAA